METASLPSHHDIMIRIYIRLPGRQSDATGKYIFLVAVCLLCCPTNRLVSTGVLEITLLFNKIAVTIHNSVT